MINNEKKGNGILHSQISQPTYYEHENKKRYSGGLAAPVHGDGALEDFSKHIILTNFDYYLDLFAEKYNAPIIGENKNMPNVSHDGITMINFGMGSANAATVLDLLSAIEPEAVLFIGKCGGLKAKHHEGDYILPIAAIKGEGTSNDYMPKEVPSLPSFSVQKACSKIITNHDRQYYTGVVYTTNRRVWEFDENFKEYLIKTRGAGRGYGNRHDFHRRVRQSYTDGSLIANIRHAYDFRRHKNV